MQGICGMWVSGKCGGYEVKDLGKQLSILRVRMREKVSKGKLGTRERGSHTPQVGMAEAAGAQAVWAITEAKKRAKEARTVEDFMLSMVWVRIVE
jgi:hypothetical protein